MCHYVLSTDLSARSEMSPLIPTSWASHAAPQVHTVTLLHVLMTSLSMAAFTQIIKDNTGNCRDSAIHLDASEQFC